MNSENDGEWKKLKGRKKDQKRQRKKTGQDILIREDFKYAQQIEAHDIYVCNCNISEVQDPKNRKKFTLVTNDSAIKTK